MKTILKGTGVALVTPFHKQGTIDFGSLEKLVDYTVNNGVDYLVVLGTTGEAVTLSKDEKYAIVQFVKDQVAGRLPIVMGLGGYNTQDVVDCMQKTDFDGIEAILSVTPYYNKPTQRGLYLHYKHLASASPLPVILYNVPGRTSVNLSAETTLTLAKDFKSIIGIKEASGNFSQIMDIISNRPKGFLVISGDDALTLPMIALGADGVISVVANAYPAAFSKMVKAALGQKMEEARKLHYLLMPFINLLFADGSPGGVKAALDKMNIVQNNLRLPVVKVNKSIQYQITAMISELKEQGIEA